MKKVENENILKIYDIIDQPEVVWYITEYCSGGSLWYLTQHVGTRSIYAKITKWERSKHLNASFKSARESKNYIIIVLPIATSNLKTFCLNPSISWGNHYLSSNWLISDSAPKK